MFNTSSCENEFLNVVNMEIPVFRDVTPCGLVERHLSARSHGVTSPETEIFTFEVVHSISELYNELSRTGVNTLLYLTLGIKGTCCTIYMFITVWQKKYVVCVCVRARARVHACVNGTFPCYSSNIHRVSRVYIKDENKKAQAEPRKPALLLQTSSYINVGLLVLHLKFNKFNLSHALALSSCPGSHRLASYCR
jgi:hypothetical protein